MSIIFNQAQVRLSTTTSTGTVVIGTTTTGGTPEGSGLTDFSAFVARVRINRDFDEHDDTVMGMSAHSRVPGLESWDMEMELIQEFSNSAALNIDKRLHDIIDGRLKIVAAIRPVAAARSSDNPEYYGHVRLFSHTPMDGAVGDLLKTTPSFRSAGSLTRSVCATV